MDKVDRNTLEHGMRKHRQSRMACLARPAARAPDTVQVGLDVNLARARHGEIVVDDQRHLTRDHEHMANV
jgi:hypothetical protein